ncbi:glutathione S-transferase C-terminal domain-containing protein isoform X2 [Vombatus ursinus]|nr:glutathione S-transferase C-terminal domain-containing protein isoform X2 [Vombatus ursinus]XP_027693290.1 glutathione S-transferase C-terminal domain-containing protein isoform X2 [Vombatus ursinus]XP_027693291.1 glutathione S-transferase C-terminal domain-containing protein isoform X2 [Vombatus ursinus]
MKGSGKSFAEEHLYLEFSHQMENCIFPLHTSITLFLLSYCDCKDLRVFLVSSKENADVALLHTVLPQDLEVQIVSRQELPVMVQSCCLPVAVKKADNFCRAGLSVTLRHIIQKTYEADTSKKEVLELLGFKKTCLKACAEVSQWTRLCELSIPLAVERFLSEPLKPQSPIPEEMLQLEKKLREPVRVHNDDKIRRQKLKQQQEVEVPRQSPGSGHQGALGESAKPPTENLELRVALSRLRVQEAPAETPREPVHIRKMQTLDLPPLDHLFAEGLYFTLADLVLLPCVHQFLAHICKKRCGILAHLPLIASWYQKIQEVPGVQRAAAKCRVQFLQLSDLLPTLEKQPPILRESPEMEEKNCMHFIGGPRPTISKLMKKGIEAKLSPHPCPTWTLDWSSLPAAVSPEEGKMSTERALRKQQQLNNLVSVVTNMAKPGDIVVDFCSGGGHVGIVLAHVLPSCQVVLIENKELSLVRAKKRSDDLGLSNIWFIQANLDYFTGKFNIGVALHACGVATDMVIEHCTKTQAAFVTCPCCYGFIQNTLKFTFPRSEPFKEVLSYKEHMILCRFADQTAVQLPQERRLIGKQCMCLVDLDRAWAAEEHGYSVQVISMEPESCSPKNNMIIGVPV